MSSVKFAKLRAALKKQADENREQTQQNLKKAEELQKQLITAKLQKWAVIKSGQGSLLIGRKYGLNQTQVPNLSLFKLQIDRRSHWMSINLKK